MSETPVPLNHDLSFLRNTAVGGPPTGNKWKTRPSPMGASFLFRSKVKSLNSAEDHQGRKGSPRIGIPTSLRPSSARRPFSASASRPPSSRPSSARTLTSHRSNDKDDLGDELIEGEVEIEPHIVYDAPDATDTHAFSSAGRKMPPDLAPGKERLVFERNTYEPDKSLQKIFDTTG